MDSRQLHHYARRWRDRADQARDEAERADCRRLAERYERVIALLDMSEAPILRLDGGC
ncbi:MAG TPA: hypothetical protein VGR32_11860 [Brevundimonas sp.]|jgi:hypothetical protein|uniref:hypothetical protein n=1 Tax=Brevundimonas sp. TaxID=1871086 RepID=UPI002DF61731|nr:hypothetical protein [Brevundimonas sp.]